MEKKVNVKATKAVENEMKRCDIFTIVKVKGKYIIAIGNNIVDDEKFETMRRAEEYIKSKPYKLLINTCCFAMEMNNKMKEKEVKQ